MTKINFWEKESLKKILSSLYGIDYEILNAIEHNYSVNEPFRYFMENITVKLDTINIDDFLFVCKHGTTSIDHQMSLKKFGLTSLKFNISNDESPLYNFFKDYNVYFMDDGISINDIEYPFYYNKCCSFCFYGNKDPDNCDSRICRIKDCIDLGNLSIKLLKDNGETEFFMYKNSSIFEYSTIGEYPEIIDNIDGIRLNICKENFRLADKWKASNDVERLLITCEIPYSSFSFISSRDFEKLADEYLDFPETCSKDYSYRMTGLPKCFADNVWLIKTSVDILSDKLDELYCAIPNEEQILYENLAIEEY